MNTETTLPEGFEQLEPFVEAWSIEGAANRSRRRIDSSEQERVAFFNAAKDLAGPALAMLDRKPLNEFDDRETRLMNLILSLAHVSLAVEVQGDDEPKHATNARYITITRASSDFNA